MNRAYTGPSSPSRRPVAAPLRRINEETTTSSSSLSSSPPKPRRQVANEGNKSSPSPSPSTPSGARSLPASPVSISTPSTTGSPRRRHKGKIVTPLESRQDDVSTAASSAAAAAAAEASVQDLEHENQTLEEQCEDLEDNLIRLHEAGNVFKMKTSLSLSSYQNTIDRLTSETNQLQQQCLVLEQQLDDLRVQNAAKQLEIMTMEDDLNRTEI